MLLHLANLLSTIRSKYCFTQNSNDNNSVLHYPIIHNTNRRKHDACIFAIFAIMEMVLKTGVGGNAYETKKKTDANQNIISNSDVFTGYVVICR